MKKELQDKLFDQYPKIFAQKDSPPPETLMCWGFECDDGWYNIIDKLCMRIRDYLNSNAKVPQVEAVQVKEKFGGLRFYYDGGDDTIDTFIDEAEKVSLCTCENCGLPGKIRGKEWVKTLCDDCVKAQHR